MSEIPKLNRYALEKDQSKDDLLKKEFKNGKKTDYDETAQRVEVGHFKELPNGSFGITKISLEKKREIRRLTKKYDTADRNKSAGEINEIRLLHFKNNAKLKDALSLNEIDIVNINKEITFKSDQINELNIKITDLQSSLISKIYNRSKLNYLELDKNKKNEQLQEYIKQRNVLINDNLRIDDLMNRKDLLKEAKKKLELFYVGHLNNLPIYNKQEQKEFELKLQFESEDKAASKIENVIQQYNVGIIHGLRSAGDDLMTNDALKSNIPWAIKLKMIIAVEPTLSCSSIKSDYDKDYYWSNFGIFINKGEVITASRQDIGSVVEGINKRNIWNKKPKLGKMASTINSAVTTHTYKQHNEIVVSKPAVCGFYIYETSDEKNNTPSHNSIKSIIENELALPVYMISNGKYWSTKYNESTNRYVKNEPVDNPSKFNTKISEANKLKVKQEIFDNFPVELNSKLEDIRNIGSAASGKELFLKLGYHKILPKVKGHITDLDGQEVELITSYKGPGYKKKLYIEKKLFWKKNKTYILSSVDVFTKKETRTTLNHFESERAKGFFIQLGPYSYRLDKNIFGPDDYSNAMAETINDIKKRIKTGNYKEGETHEFLNGVLKLLAFHAYGYADQAKALNENGISKKAHNVASGVLDYDEYNVIMQERLGENGEIKISKEDLTKLG